jgi:filamentous hemagglutinin
MGTSPWYMNADYERGDDYASAGILAASVIGPGALAKGARLLGAAEGLGGTHALRAINPSHSITNCANCSVALDATLGGRPASALPGPYTNSTELAAVYGAKNMGFWTTTSAIERELLRRGPGARGIVFGSRGTGQIGHFFNAVNQGGTVKFLDGQLGKNAPTGDFVQFLFLLTGGGT